MATMAAIPITVCCHKLHACLQWLTQHGAVRSSFLKVKQGPPDVAHVEWTNAKVSEYSSDVEEDDYQQARDLWNIFLKQGNDEIFISNLANNIKKALPEVQKEAVSKLESEFTREGVEWD